MRPRWPRLSVCLSRLWKSRRLRDAPNAGVPKRDALRLGSLVRRHTPVRLGSFCSAVSSRRAQRVMDEIELLNAERILGHSFSDRLLLVKALTHASVADTRLDSNERLEFLGDAVLGLVVCDFLYVNYDDLLEGEMTKIKSSVVSRPTCAEVARELGMDELLKLGKGMGNRGVLPSSVLSAVFESLIGALYLDAGLEKARAFILGGLHARIERAADSGHQFNFKSVLQQAVQQNLDLTPQYVVLDEQGPDHAKCFEVCVEIGARRFGSSWGPSKKQAEQQAALHALLELGLAQRIDNGDVRLCDPAATTIHLHCDGQKADAAISDAS